MLKLLAPTILAAFGLLSPAQALTMLPVATPDAPLIQVFDGCGPYGHRGPYGHCRPGGELGGYIRGQSCPAGWHIGPYGRYCWPNRGPYMLQSGGPGGQFQ